MAEGGSILDTLLGWLSPRAAEATVSGGPDEMAMLEAVERANRARQGQYVADMQQRILRQAQASPAVVRVARTPGLLSPQPSPENPSAVPALADFNPQTSVIRYDPGVPGWDRPSTMAHELLHFLNQQTPQPQAVETQHALIKQVLGEQGGLTHPAALAGYQPGAFSPVEHSIINEWMGGPRDWPR